MPPNKPTTPVGLWLMVIVVMTFVVVTCVSAIITSNQSKRTAAWAARKGVVEIVKRR